MGRPSRTEQTAADRKTRLKWGDPKLRMSVNEETVERLKREGKEPRWVNDDGRGKIEALKRRGYDFVSAEGVAVGDDLQGNTDMGANVSRVVGTLKNGDPMRAYLMATNTEFYEEDQDEKEKINKMVDDAIRRGEPGGPEQATENDGKGNKTYVKNTTYKP